VSADGPGPSRPRLRWLTLAELVGVLALVVAAAGWWDSHREHLQEDRERAAAAKTQAAEAKRATLRESFLLTGSGDTERLRLAPARGDQVIQTQTLVFPSAVRKDPVETTGNPRIDRRWFESGLKDAHALPKDDAEARLPVAVETAYVDAGETRTDRAIYWIAYSAKHRLLRGSQVQLDGLSLARRGVTGDLQAAVDAVWAKQHPEPK
jgi:hypothetical protein